MVQLYLQYSVVAIDKWSSSGYDVSGPPRVPSSNNSKPEIAMRCALAVINIIVQFEQYVYL